MICSEPPRLWSNRSSKRPRSRSTARAPSFAVSIFDEGAILLERGDSMAANKLIHQALAARPGLTSLQQRTLGQMAHVIAFFTDDFIVAAKAFMAANGTMSDEDKELWRFVLSCRETNTQPLVLDRSKLSDPLMLSLASVISQSLSISKLEEVIAAVDRSPPPAKCKEIFVLAEYLRIVSKGRESEILPKCNSSLEFEPYSWILKSKSWDGYNSQSFRR
jgi:hypothetical protein